MAHVLNEVAFLVKSSIMMTPFETTKHTAHPAKRAHDIHINERVDAGRPNSELGHTGD